MDQLPKPAVVPLSQAKHGSFFRFMHSPELFAVVKQLVETCETIFVPVAARGLVLTVTHIAETYVQPVESVVVSSPNDDAAHIDALGAAAAN